MVSCPAHVRFKVPDGTDPLDTHFVFDPGCHQMNLRLGSYSPEQLDALLDVAYDTISHQIEMMLVDAKASTREWAHSLLAEGGSV